MSTKTSPSNLRRWTANLGLFGLLVFVWIQGRGSEALPGGAEKDRFDGVSFREVSREVGIDFTHRPTRVDPRVGNLSPHITAVGAAVSVADANGDGWPDLYTTTSAHGASNALYVNRGDGTFQDAAPAAGLADLNREGVGCSMGSVWGDFDADGDEDVFVYKWGRSQLFRNLGDLRFEDVTPGSGLDVWMNSNAATWFDYDRDGDLDLYVAGYFEEEHDLWNLRTTRIMHDSFEFATNGGKNRLFRNDSEGGAGGDGEACRFTDVTDDVGAGSRRWTYAAVAADFDGDGWQDLYIANDYGTEELLLNREGRTFVEANDIGLEKESKSGMCVALGDVRNEGRLSVFVTNISKPGYLFQGNNLRLNRLDEGGPMLQIAQGAVANCGWAWGAQFGDLDKDGLQDLVVVNGFISASRDRDYWYQMSKIGLATGDVVADAANWPPIDDRSLSGYERTRVLMNTGGRGGTFVEVGERVGVTDERDGRAVALADLDRDGDLDLIVANQAGPLLVYRNETSRDAHWVAFDLVGTASNRSAYGAEVLVEFAGGRQLQVLTAACGFSSQNDRRLFFGLGQAPGTVRARVRWPSGAEQELGEVAVDKAHRIVEEKLR